MNFVCRGFLYDARDEVYKPSPKFINFIGRTVGGGGGRGKTLV